MAVKRSEFSPAQHVFNFTNRFDFPDFYQFKLPFIRVAPFFLNKVISRLCGEMGLAALDYFHAGQLTPGLSSLTQSYHLWGKQLPSPGPGQADVKNDIHRANHRCLKVHVEQILA